MGLQTLYIGAPVRPPAALDAGKEEGFNNIYALLFREEYTKAIGASTQYPVMIGAGLGKTNCCGAKELWTQLFKEEDFLHVVKTCPASVFKLNTPDVNPLDVTQRGYSIKQRIEALNSKLKGIFQFEVETLNRMEHIVVMKFDNFNKYLEWKQAK